MVKVTGYKLRESLEGKSFFALTLQGGIEIVKSAAGNSYATIKKASMPTTFDEATCESLVGTELPGFINKVSCDAYNYVIEQTGEVIVLFHRYEYEEQEHAPKTDFTKVYEPSKNGVKEAV